MKHNVQQTAIRSLANAERALSWSGPNRCSKIWAFYTSMLGRHAGRWLLMLAVLPAVGFATVAQGGAPKSYERFAVLRIDARPAARLPGEGIICTSTENELLRSRIVLTRALEVPGVSDLPWIASRKVSNDQVDWLADKIKIVRAKDDNILLIAMKGDDPRQLAILVNAVAKAFVDLLVVEQRRLLVARRDVFETNYRSKLAEVTRRREMVRKLADKIGPDPKLAQAKQQLLLDYVLEIRKEISLTKEAIARKQAGLEQFKRDHGIRDEQIGAPREPLPVEIVNEAVADDPEYRIRVGNVQLLEEKLAKILVVVEDPNSPMVRSAREGIVKARQLVEDRKNVIREQLQREWKEGKIVNRTKAKYDSLVAELEGLKAKHAAMTTHYEELTKTIQDMATCSEEFERRKEDLAAAVETTNRLALALEQCDQELRRPDRVTLVQAAPMPPSAPVKDCCDRRRRLRARH